MGQTRTISPVSVSSSYSSNSPSSSPSTQTMSPSAIFRSAMSPRLGSSIQLGFLLTGMISSSGMDLASSTTWPFENAREAYNLGSKHSSFVFPPGTRGEGSEAEAEMVMGDAKA